MIVLGGILYALVFLIIGYQVPKVALALIVSLAPFNYDVSAGGPFRFSLGEINLLLTGVIFLLRRRRVRLGALAAPSIAYLVLGLLSSLLSWRDTSLVSLIQMVIYLVVAVVVFTSFADDAQDYRPGLNALIVGGLILAFEVIRVRSGYVLGLHKNSVGASLACCVVVAVELWFSSAHGRTRNLLFGSLVVLVGGLFFSLSRGAWLATACGIFVLLGFRREFGLLARTVVVIVPIVVLCWSFLPEKGKAYATDLSSDNWNIKMRFESIEIARNSFARDRVFGVGVGLRKEYDATNIVWLTLAETGVLGLSAFLVLHLAVFWMVWKTQRQLQRRDPLFSLAALGAALVTGKFIHGLVDHYWSRGPLLISWAAAGMATHSYIAVRARNRRSRQIRAAETLRRIQLFSEAE